MRLQLTVIDSPDPARSAAFYSTLLDLPVTDTDDDWVQLAGATDGAPTLDAGARKAERQPGVRLRVYLDPLGHPFCLVLRHGVPTPG